MESINRRRLIQGAAGIPIAATLGAKSLTGTSAAPYMQESAGTITLSRAEVIRQPWMSGGQRDFYSLLFNTLVTNNFEHDAIVPELAESWESNPEGTEFTFKLRQDVTWHDGQPFTSADVVFSFIRMLNPLTGLFGSFLQPINGAQAYADGTAETVEGIQAVDDHTVKITLGEPSAGFLVQLPILWILPAHLLGEIAPDAFNGSAYFTTGFVGTGPFKFVEWVEEQYVELTRNDAYFLGAPQIERVIHRFIKQPEVAVLALENAEVDFYQILPITEVARLEESPQITTLGDIQSAFFFLMFNLTRPIFQDKRVRQAFGYAIDKQTVTETLLPNGAMLISSPLGWSEFWTAPDLPEYLYDPERAKSLLTEAGWDFGTEVEMLYNYTDQVNKNVVTAFQQQWADADLKVNIRLVEEELYRELVAQEANFDFVYDAGSVIDPDQLWIYFHSSSLAPASYNRSRYINPELDVLLEEGRRTLDPEQRRLIYNQAQQILTEDVPHHFLWAPIRYSAVNDRIQNFKWTIKGNPLMNYQASEETWTIAS